MMVFVIRREAGGGDIDEIVGLCTTERQAQSTIDAWEGVAEAEEGEAEDAQEYLHVGLYDDTERIWYEGHLLRDGCAGTDCVCGHNTSYGDWVSNHCYHCGRTFTDIRLDGPTEGCLCDPATH